MHDMKTALEKLSAETDRLKFPLLQIEKDGAAYDKQKWPVDCTDKIIVCVYKDQLLCETFHRSDYFFFDFSYRGTYYAVSDRADHVITMNENACYIGQPFNGYARRTEDGKDSTVISVLIRKDVFVKEFISAISNDFSLFHFFLDPEKDPCLDGYIHLHIQDKNAVRTVLEMMVLEYADRRADTQSVLKPMMLTLLMLISREYRQSMRKGPQSPITYKIIEYINENFGSVRLKDVAKHFSYHPNYISALIRKETGRTFSELLKESRMRSAKILLLDSNLSVEEIVAKLGYKNSSSFYKAFRDYFGVPPREYKEYIKKV
ncbi:helix-turn-helix transcriptional regulator [Ihubacter sp. rT4E-8]|uniref:helix-turn-helix transcriptional regulator n=1 Tax=unclassified Ihubacter TaxID=2633299 RepID=UPI00137A42F4